MTRTPSSSPDSDREALARRVAELHYVIPYLMKYLGRIDQEKCSTEGDEDPVMTVNLVFEGGLRVRLTATLDNPPRIGATVYDLKTGEPLNAEPVSYVDLIRVINAAFSRKAVSRVMARPNDSIEIATINQERKLMLMAAIFELTFKLGAACDFKARPIQFSSDLQFTFRDRSDPLSPMTVLVNFSGVHVELTLAHNQSKPVGQASVPTSNGIFRAVNPTPVDYDRLPDMVQRAIF